MDRRSFIVGFVLGLLLTNNRVAADVPGEVDDGWDGEEFPPDGIGCMDETQKIKK